MQALDAAKKEALDGGLAKDVSLATWLKEQPPSVQFRHIGPEQWIPWKQGKLSLSNMVSAATGKPLTLEELTRDVATQHAVDLDGMIEVGTKLDTVWQKALGKQGKALVTTQDRLVGDMRRMAAKPGGVDRPEYSKMYDEWIDVRHAITTHQRAILDTTLRKIRPLGEVKSQWTAGSDARTMRAVDDVADSLPREWLQRSHAQGPMHGTMSDRGFYNARTSNIDLSGSLVKRQSVAFHEFGHRFEQVVPDVFEAEDLFYQKRTGADHPFNRLQKLGSGYRDDELTRPDRFVDPYMGKPYPGQRNYELLSMGLESVFTGSYNLSADPEFRRFILGILAVL